MFAPILTIDLGQDNECLDLISDRQILAEILGALPVCTADGKIT